MSLNPRLSRLIADYEKIRELELRSPFVEIVKTKGGEPPIEYTLRLTCKGISKLAGGRPVYSEEHRLRISLPADYPRSQPKLAMLSPVFHPNFHGNTICIGQSYSPSMGLDDLVVVIVQMIRYENFNPGSAYNHNAVVWAKKNKRLLPLDKRQIVEEEIGVKIFNDIQIISDSDDLVGQINIF
jgi:ubiquitin-protein ligase